jgi:hypothetical protein
VYILENLKRKKCLVDPKRSESKFFEYIQYLGKELLGPETLVVYNFFVATVYVLAGIFFIYIISL